MTAAESVEAFDEVELFYEAEVYEDQVGVGEGGGGGVVG